MSMYDTVRLLAADLELGENRYTECPACNRKGKFSISKRETGESIYHCFRPHCELHRGGVVNGTGGELVRTRLAAAPKQEALVPYSGTLLPLTDEWKEYLHTTIGFDEEHIQASGVMYAPDSHRLAYPIRSPLGRRRGWLLRSYSGDSPKGLKYPSVREPMQSWYINDINDKTVVVVEDIPSAVRVARYTNAVALNGTGCGMPSAMEIAEQVRNVIWALDADVLAYNIHLRRKYQLLFESSYTLPIDKDFKDMDETVIAEYFLKGDD